MIKQEIVKLTEESIKELQKEKFFPAFKMPEIKILRPDERAHGDYAINTMSVIGKEIMATKGVHQDKDPMEIAEKIKEKMETRKKNLFERIEVVRSGFINFFVSKEYLHKQIPEILEKGENYGQLEIGKNKKVQVEFISANPTGPLTVGNARGGVFGDTLANILKKAGFKTEKAYYINDYGMQVLTLGHSVLKDAEAKYKGDYIDRLHERIKETDPYKAGQEAAKIIVEEMIKKTTDKAGVKYDEWFLESELYNKNEVDKALSQLEKKGLTYEKEGALWFKSTAFGDKRDRVVIKSDGWKTYLAGDIAYHKYKFENKKFDKVINIWGADHLDDEPGLQAGVASLGHKGKLDIVFLQFVTILEKSEKLRMSKRAGIYITMDELLDKVGKDIVRFFFLTKSANTHLNFDLSLAKEQSEKNPVYYVQYAHARICSILRKTENREQKTNNKNYSLLNHLLELNLIRQLIKLPEIIEDTAKDYQVHRISQYATDVARSFHQFYRDRQVISEDKKLTDARLLLISATKIVLKNVLDLMGISSPEAM